MKNTYVLLAFSIAASAAAGCSGAEAPAGVVPASSLPAVREERRRPATPAPIGHIYEQLSFNGRTFSVVQHACTGFRLGGAGTYQAIANGALVLAGAVSVSPGCVPTPMPTPAARLFVVGVPVTGGITSGIPIAGPATLQAHPWVFAPQNPGLVTQKGAGYDFFVVTLATTPSPSPSPVASPSATPSAKPSGVQPWQMFHGNAQHTGYAAVNGPASATLKWRFAAGTGVGAPPTSVAIASSGIVYLSGQAAVYALNSGGGVVWQQSYPTTPNPQGPALSNDGTVLYFTAGNSIVAVSAATGTQLWMYLTGGETLFGPTISPNGTIVAGSHDTYLYAINANGTLDWKYQTQGAVSYPASIDASGNVYLGGGDAHAGPDPNVYAFTSNGTLSWMYDTGETRVGSPALAGGTVFAPADPVLYALYASSGSVVWQSPNCGPPPKLPCGSNETTGIISPAIGPDGTVYVATDQGVVSAINPSTGATDWTYTTPSTIGIPSFPVVDANGNVYYGGENGTMYALSKSGSLLWSYPTGGPIAEAAPALGPDGTLYFSSSDGYLYAIGTAASAKKHRWKGKPAH